MGPRSAFQPVLWHLLETFCQQYPQIVPDVQLEDRVGNRVEDRVDVGFRLGMSPHEGVVARRLFAVQMVIFASPAYIAQYGAPDSLAALQSHRCSAFRNAGTGAVVPWRVRVNGDVVDYPVTPAICTNDEILELHAVLAGQAIGQLAGVTAGPYIRSGQLVPLLPDTLSDRSSYFVYFGSRNSLPARALIDLTAQTLTDTCAFVLSPRELQAAQARARL